MALSYIMLAVICKSINITFIMILNTLLMISKVIVLTAFSMSIYMASIHKNAIDDDYSYFSSNIRIFILISYSFIWYIIQGFDIYVLIKNVKSFLSFILSLCTIIVTLLFTCAFKFFLS